LLIERKRPVVAPSEMLSSRLRTKGVLRMVTRRSWLTAMWVAASGLVVAGSGCSKCSPEPAEKYGGPAPSQSSNPPLPPSEPLSLAGLQGKWYAVGAAALSQDAASLDAVVKRLGELDAARAAQVIQVLDAMASQAPTPEGLETASKLGHDAKLNIDPSWTGSGSAPNVAALHDAGMAVLQGLVARALEAEKGKPTAESTALALVKTFRAMPLPKQFDSGGLNDGKKDRRTLMEEVGKHLDETTWHAVLKGARTWPSVPNPP